MNSALILTHRPGPCGGRGRVGRLPATSAAGGAEGGDRWGEGEKRLGSGFRLRPKGGGDLAGPTRGDSGVPSLGGGIPAGPRKIGVKNWDGAVGEMGGGGRDGRQ